MIWLASQKLEHLEQRIAFEEMLFALHAKLGIQHCVIVQPNCHGYDNAVTEDAIAATGQAYKGGPNSGVFLQITADDADDLAIPGHGASFGVVKAAQARGDFEVLAERGRRALRVHLKGDTASGLAALETAIRAAA